MLGSLETSQAFYLVADDVAPRKHSPKAALNAEDTLKLLEAC